MTALPTWLATYSGRQLSRRRFLGAAAGGAGAATLIACGGSGDGGDTPQLTVDPAGVRTPGAVVFTRDEWQLADETAHAVPGGVYTGRELLDLTSSWDPWLANVGLVEDFNDISYEYLTRGNRGPGISPASTEYTKVMPHLAEGWEVSSDSLSYTFTLRQGVKFHPMAPVNARVMDIDDWRTSFERFLEIGSNRATLMALLDKVEYPDARHMVVKMKAPYGPFLSRMNDKDFAVKIVPKELNANDQMRATTQIGTNYRMVDSVQPSVSRNFKRWDDYWGGKPFIERWAYPIIPEASNAYGQFIAKNIISVAPASRDVLKVRQDVPDALIVGLPLSRMFARGLFGKREAMTMPWKDARVRIAIRKAVNYDAILDFQSNREAFSAAGIEVETVYGTHGNYDPLFYLDPTKGDLGKDGDNYLYDVAEAKRLVDAAGFVDGFDIDYVALQGSRVEIQQLMIDELKKSGFIRPADRWLNTQEYYDAVTYAADFKGLAITSAPGNTEPDYALYQNYHSSGRATSPYASAEMDDIVQRQRRELDPLKRIEVLKEFQRYAAKTFPHMATHHLFGAFRFDWPWLHNVNYDLQQGHKHWLDADMPRRNG